MKKMILAALAVLGVALGTVSMGTAAHAATHQDNQRNTGWIGSSGNG